MHVVWCLPVCKTCSLQTNTTFGVGGNPQARFGFHHFGALQFTPSPRMATPSAGMRWRLDSTRPQFLVCVSASPSGLQPEAMFLPRKETYIVDRYHKEFFSTIAVSSGVLQTEIICTTKTLHNQFNTDTVSTTTTLTIHTILTGKKKPNMPTLFMHYPKQAAS
ncbi:unnamed protein product [Ectocarpus sp. 12 AP-2014]